MSFGNYGYAKHIRPDLVKEPLIKPEQETEEGLLFQFSYERKPDAVFPWEMGNTASN